MGAYSNPQGFIDTQTGQHFRDLQANIAGAVAGFGKAYKEKQDAIDEELKKNRDELIKNTMAVDNWTVEQMNAVKEASAKSGTIEWNSTYDKWIQRAADIKMQQLKGNMDPSLRKEMLAIQSSIGEYVNGIGNLSSMNTTFTELKAKGVGVEGGLSAFNDPIKDKGLSYLSGALPGGRKEATMEYDPESGKMKQVVKVFDSNNEEVTTFDMSTLNSLSGKPSGFVTVVPETTKAIEIGNASIKALEVTTKNAKGEDIPTGVLPDSYKNTTKNGKEGDITWVNGVGTKKIVTHKTMKNGKEIPDQWKEVVYQAYDVDKLTDATWETTQRAQAASLFVEPNSAKSGWYESIKPALTRALSDNTLPEDQKSKIKTLLGEINFTVEQAKTQDFGPIEKEIVTQGYLELAKIATKNMYGMKPVAEEEKSTATIEVETFKEPKTGGDSEPKSPGVMNLYTKNAAQEYFKRAINMSSGLNNAKGDKLKKILGRSVIPPNGLMINGVQVKGAEIVLNPNSKINNVKFDILDSSGNVIEENINQNQLNNMFKGSISATKGDIAARQRNELQ